jgi:hypothetical protein
LRVASTIAFYESDVDDNSESFKRRCIKWFVKTKIGDIVKYGLCNLTSKVEVEVSMNYGNEEQVLKDDEMMNIDGTYHGEAACDGNVVMLNVNISDVFILGVVRSSRCHRRASQQVICYGQKRIGIICLCFSYMVSIACFVYIGIHRFRMKNMCIYSL